MNLPPAREPLAKHHVMFDIDGTLLQSYEVDSVCFADAVKEVTQLDINTDWSVFTHITDAGILDEFLLRQRVPDRQIVAKEVKRIFIQKLELYLAVEAVKQIPGANAFLQYLRARENFSVSIATGGWRESALLKLESAGINIADIPVATSDDHYARTEIMKIAASRAVDGNVCAYTYFGDQRWDKIACDTLGYQLVSVGNRLNHQPKIENYNSIDEVMACINATR